MSLVSNERRKLTANWLNALAASAITAGTFAPLAALLYGFQSNHVDTFFIIALSVICLTVGIGLHIIGLQMLRGLKP